MVSPSVITPAIKHHNPDVGALLAARRSRGRAPIGRSERRPNLCEVAEKLVSYF